MKQMKFEGGSTAALEPGLSLVQGRGTREHPFATKFTACEPAPTAADSHLWSLARRLIKR